MGVSGGRKCYFSENFPSVLNEWSQVIWFDWYCVKGVCIRSSSGPYFPACGLNTERFVALRIQSECGTIRTRINPNKDTFYAVWEPSKSGIMTGSNNHWHSQLSFNCWKSTTETLEKVRIMFKIKNKNTRTTSLVFLLLTGSK